MSCCRCCEDPSATEGGPLPLRMDSADDWLPSRSAKRCHMDLFTSLPDTLLLEILRRVGDEGRGQYMAVCKRWSRLSAEAQRCIRIRRGGVKYSDAHLIKQIRRFSNLTAVSIKGQVEPTDFFVGALGSSFPDLQTLHLRMHRVSVSRAAWGALFECTTSLRKLSLHVPGIELPSSITRLKFLEELLITGSGKNPTILPANIGDVTSLRSLKMRGGAIESLVESVPDSVTRLVNLEHLDLSFSSGLLPTELGNMASLKRVTILSGGLTLLLPLSIGRLANLEHLELRCSGLRALPASFSQLTSLKHLHVHCSSMDAIPEPVLALTGLQSLEIVSMRGEGLARVAKLKSLLRLKLRHVKGRLHDAVCRMTGLKELSLRDYNFSLPHDLGHLTNLTHLELTDNPVVEDLPATFANLKSLKHLTLQNLPLLSYLPANLGDLKNLQYLTLGRCPGLVDLPECIARLENLRSLDIDDMDGIRVPECFTSLRKLLVFNIWGSVASIPMRVLDMEALADRGDLEQLREQAAMGLGND